MIYMIIKHGWIVCEWRICATYVFVICLSVIEKFSVQKKNEDDLSAKNETFSVWKKPPRVNFIKKINK